MVSSNSVLHGSNQQAAKLGMNVPKSPSVSTPQFYTGKCFTLKLFQSTLKMCFKFCKYFGSFCRCSESEAWHGDVISQPPGGQPCYHGDWWIRQSGHTPRSAPEGEGSRCHGTFWHAGTDRRKEDCHGMLPEKQGRTSHVDFGTSAKSGDAPTGRYTNCYTANLILKSLPLKKKSNDL